MPDDGKKKRQWSLRALVIITLTAGVLLGIGVELYRLDQQLASEYLTAGVIHDVSSYVGSHGGQWPTSWETLGIRDRRTLDLTEINFDLKSDELLKHRELIYTSIQPKSHHYHTYPHAKENLDALWELIQRKIAPQ